MEIRTNRWCRLSFGPPLKPVKNPLLSATWKLFFFEHQHSNLERSWYESSYPAKLENSLTRLSELQLQTWQKMIVSSSICWSKVQLVSTVFAFGYVNTKCYPDRESHLDSKAKVLKIIRCFSFMPSQVVELWHLVWAGRVQIPGRTWAFIVSEKTCIYFLWDSGFF